MSFTRQIDFGRSQLVIGEEQFVEFAFQGAKPYLRRINGVPAR